MPEDISRERVETEDFAVTRGQDHAALHHDVDKVGALEPGRPNLLASAAIERNDRSLDADEY